LSSRRNRDQQSLADLVQRIRSLDADLRRVEPRNLTHEEGSAVADLLETVKSLTDAELSERDDRERDGRGHTP
jgi:hypothetical protein